MTLSYDIYSPKLGRFIEVDERQHFSRQQLARIKQRRVKPGRSLYPKHFWNEMLNRLLKSPACDRDPPHRDEQRAYRDEAREVLPLAYGLSATIRLDQFSLTEAKMDVIGLVKEILKEEKS